MRRSFFAVAAAIILPLLTPAPSTAQVSSGSGEVGVAVKVGTLGAGVQGAVRITRRMNVRGGINLGRFNATVSPDDRINFAGTAKLESVEAAFDWFVLGNFRASPGLLVFNNNHFNATASAPTGTTFALGYQSYVSDTPPLGGTGVFTFRKLAPMFALGYGNLVPRGRHHASVSVDIGVLYQGAPNVTLALTGQGCVPQLACQDLASPALQPNVVVEQAKISSFASKFYPVASVGFGWRF